MEEIRHNAVDNEIPFDVMLHLEGRHVWRDSKAAARCRQVSIGRPEKSVPGHTALRTNAVRAALSPVLSGAWTYVHGGMAEPQQIDGQEQRKLQPISAAHVPTSGLK